MAISARGYPINEYLNDAEIKRLCNYIADKESTSAPDGPINTQIGGPKEPGVIKAGHQNYGVINHKVYVGKYQFGYGALADTKFVKFYPFPHYNNNMLRDPANWLGKMGCKDLDSFLKNPEAQEVAMKENLKVNFNYMRAKIADCDKCDISGYLAAAHLVGWSGSLALRRNINKCDAYGTDAASYFYRGVCAFENLPIAGGARNPQRDPSKQEPLPRVEKSADYGVKEARNSNLTPKADIEPKQLNNPRDDDIKVPVDVVNKYANLGFRDPDFVYPKSSYVGHPDTNKLAFHKDIARTVVEKKESNIHGHIPTADNFQWAEPTSPYNARYPYNKVTESESGHVIEIDDTPGHERLHNYHRSGTYDEVDSQGTKVQRIVGDSYEIIDRNGNIFINGKCNLTVGGACNLLVLSNANITVKGDTNMTCENDVNWNVSGTMNLKVNETLNMRCHDFNLEVDNDRNEYTHGDYTNETHKDEYHRVRGSVLEQVKGGVRRMYESTLDHTVSGEVNKDYGAAYYSNVTGNVYRKFKSSYYRTVSVETNHQSGADYNVDAANIWMNSGRSSEAMEGKKITPQAKGPITTKRGKDPIELGEDNPIVDKHLIAVKTNLRYEQDRARFIDSSTPNLARNHRADEVGTIMCEQDQPIYDTPAVRSEPKAPIISDNRTIQQEGIAFEHKPQVKGATKEDTDNMVAAATKTKVTPDGVNIDPSQFLTMQIIPPTTRISKWFKVSDMLLNGNQLKENLAKIDGKQQKLSIQEIVRNMSAFAIHVLDPIKEQFPNMFMYSAFRNSTGKYTENMHGTGLAADIRFKGATVADLTKIANWIKAQLPYHQILMEQNRGRGAGSLWIHCSYNFGKKAALPCATCANGGAPGSSTTWLSKSELKAELLLPNNANGVAPGNA